MRRIGKFLFTAALIAALPISSYAAVVERDVAEDSYTINKDAKESGIYSVKVSDSSGNNVHLSFMRESSYTFMLLPDVTEGDYTVMIGDEVGTAAKQVAVISAYPTDEKLIVLTDINNAADADSVKTILKEKADVLELNYNPIYTVGTSALSSVSDSDLDIIASAVYNGGTDYAELKDFYMAYYAAKAPVLLNKANSDDEAENIGDVYGQYFNIAELEGYELIADFEEKIYPYYIGKNKKTQEAFEKVFGEYAFLCAVSNAYNYQEIIDVFSDYDDLVTFDLATYNASNKSLTAKALLGNDFSTMDELESAISSAYKNQQGQSSGVSSNGGGGNSGGKGGFGGASVSSAGNTTAEQVSGLYKDIDETHWAYDTVKYLTEKKVINGDETGNFRPEDTVTRAEFAKMIVAGFGLYDAEAEAEFSDIPNTHWAYKYVASLAKKGVINGINDTTFGGDMLISRQDMAVMISRVSSTFSTEGEPVFADSTDIADYAVSAVTSLSSMNIINGYDDDTYRPHNNATRAEAATIISRSMKLLMGGIE